MSYSAIVSGIQTRLATITSLKANLVYAPKGIDDTPMTYILLDGAELTHNAGTMTIMYRVTVRLVTRWQENDQAEAEILPYVDSIVDAIRAAPMLGGAAYNAWVSEIEGLWVTIGGIEYRAVDFTVRVKEVR